MSLILDALRKSDHQHSERRAPDVARTGEPKPRQHAPRWIWPVVGLLLINAAILMWVLLGKEPAPQTDVVQAPAQVPPSSPASKPSEATVRAEVRSLLAETIDEARATREAEPEKTTRTAATPAAISRAATTNTVSLPRYDPVRAATEWQLPVLTLELHVFAADPSARFGFINSQKVVEGSSLKEGPRVLEITQQGIILQYRSERFQLMP